jgi:L-asparaginase
MLRGLKRIALISTGGTIEKTYDELEGKLANQKSVLDVMLGKLALEGITIERVHLMNKDSLEMTDADHDAIADCARDQAGNFDGIVIVHGTDRLANTGERIAEKYPGIEVPTVLTGAMRPFEMHNTDAIQNLTEALVSVQLLEAGVYVCFHNRVLRFPGVVKDYDIRTFRYSDEGA